MSTTATAPRCTEHRQHAAGCAVCRARSRWYARVRRAALAAGEALSADPTTARARIATLTAAGWSLRGIERAAGVSRRHMTEIVAGRVKRFCHAATVDAILGVPVGPPPHLRYACGTSRRLRALAAIGWTFELLAAELGMSGCRVSELVAGAGAVVTTRVHDRVVALYERLWDTPGPSRLSAQRAARSGWAPPLAWDDDQLDDPGARPPALARDGDRRRDEYDDARVARAVAGDVEQWPDLTPIERRDVVARLARSLTDREIGERVGATHDAITRLRDRHDIPAYLACSRPSVAA